MGIYTCEMINLILTVLLGSFKLIWTISTKALLICRGCFFKELGCCHSGHSCFVPEKLSLQLFLFDISLQLPLYPRVWTERIIHDKVIQDLHPRCVLRQVIIILSCYFLHLETKKVKQRTNFRWTSRFQEAHYCLKCLYIWMTWCLCTYKNTKMWNQ